MTDSLIHYPCDFPIKIMGESTVDFFQIIVAIVLRHAPDFIPASVETRPSKAGKYTSLTCTINATSREQLDNLYLDLTSCPSVKMVL